MTDTIVDTNVILDVIGDDPVWGDWSATALIEAADRGSMVIDTVIYAELAVGFQRRAELDAALEPWPFRFEHTPWSAAFLAGAAFLRYRKQGGSRTSPLPDFFIGAHAATRGYRLLTRDRGHYARYFPTVAIISPEPLS